MKSKIVIALVVITTIVSASGVWAAAFTNEQALGGALYFDPNLSINRNQSCASCHFPTVGFDDPDSNLPVSEGSKLGLFGGRNAPSSAYAAFSPAFGFYPADGLYMGGQFWDGRVNNLADQAAGPPTNPVEMALKNKKAVVARLAENPVYVLSFKALYGIDIKKPASVNAAYGKMAKAIGEFERTRLFNQFNSKYDYFLKGLATLNEQELRGLDVFENPSKANCAACHPNRTTDGSPPLFTDFSYDNLGIPVNDTIAQLHNVPTMPIDYGLGTNPRVLAENPSIAMDDGQKVVLSEAGKFKVMTLRNIAKTAPYGHNGHFQILEDIVSFYAAPIGSFVPEVDINVNNSELHDAITLSAQDVADLVAFLRTLTDGYRLASPYGAVSVPPLPDPLL